MIDEKDIVTYLKAKKDQRILNIYAVLASVALGVLIFLEATGVEHNYTILLATLSFVFSASSFSGGARGVVSRKELLNLIGRIISSDSSALQRIAIKRKQ